MYGDILGPETGTLTLKTDTVAGCKSVLGTVTLYDPAPPEGVRVTLADSLPSVSTPAGVTIAAGTKSKNFTIRTTPVAARESGTVSATLAGATLSQPLTVRPMGLSSVSVTPSTVVGSNQTSGKATLECNAGPGAILVDLASSNAAAATPVAATVSIPQGVKTGLFDVTTSAVLARTTASISATANGITKSKKITITPVAAVVPTRLSFGNVTVGQTSAPQIATLTNQGPMAFAVNSIAITGTIAAWFSQANNCPANLAAGASCTISLTFTPTAAASKSAKLSIATSATSTPLSVSLSGSGVLP